MILWGFCQHGSGIGLGLIHSLVSLVIALAEVIGESCRNLISPFAALLFMLFSGGPAFSEGMEGTLGHGAMLETH